VAGGLFPHLWASRHGDVNTFLRQARLRAVHALKLSHTCEHIEELTLGPLRANRLTVRFRGVRAQRFTNEEPTIIAFRGIYPLKG
jgi:hypothetical protein